MLTFLHFSFDNQDFFWGIKSDPLLGVKSLNSLHTNVQLECLPLKFITPFFQGLSQLQDLSTFIKDFSTIQESYANKLTELSKKRSHSDIDESDESIVHQVFLNVRQEVADIATTYKQVVSNLQQAHKELTRYVSDNKITSQTKLDSITSSYKSLQSQKSNVDACFENNNEKSIIADNERKLFKKVSSDPNIPVMDVMVSFGLSQFTINEFNNMLLNMQHDVTAIDLKTLIGSKPLLFCIIISRSV